MNAKQLLLIFLGLCCLSGFNNFVFGQGTAFMYQGQLNVQNNPANGAYDMEFALYDAVTNGDQIGMTLTNTATSVSNGLFVATLDFGPVFTGQYCWLDVSVRTNGGGTFTELAPRQPIQSVPYAIMANNASNLLGTLSASQLSGTLAAAQLPASVITNGSAGVNLTGTFSGSGAGLARVLGSNIVNDTTVLSVVNSDSAPAPSTNWTFYEMDYTSTNFLILGGPSELQNMGAYDDYWGPIYYQSGANGPGFEYANAMSVTFGIDGSQVVVRLSGSGGIWSIVVDGVDNYITNTVPLDSDEHWYTVTFATAATRTITLNNAWPFLGVYVPVTNGFFNSKLIPHQRLVVLGDSFTEQTYQPGSTCEGLVSQMQLLLPQFDVWALGEGGTGFVNPGISGGTNFLGRIADVVNANPNDVLIYGGINDCGDATNTSVTNVIFENATNLIMSLQSRLPLAKIAVIGPQWPRSPSLTGDAIVFNCAILLSNACTVCGIPYVSPVAEPWITGNVVVPNSGNADIYTRPQDGTHPTIPAGARYLANKIVTSLSQFWNFSAPATTATSGTVILNTNSPPAPVSGSGTLWNSNNVLYWVTLLHTNYITGP
jgi:lysophospholipase L1-like esterase